MKKQDIDTDNIEEISSLLEKNLLDRNKNL